MLPIHNNYRVKCQNMPMISPKVTHTVAHSTLNNGVWPSMYRGRAAWTLAWHVKRVMWGPRFLLLHALAFLAAFCLALGRSSNNNPVHSGSRCCDNYTPSCIVLSSLCIPATYLSPRCFDLAGTFVCTFHRFAAVRSFSSRSHQLLHFTAKPLPWST
jgi:hypothetical protein